MFFRSSSCFSFRSFVRVFSFVSFSSVSFRRFRRLFVRFVRVCSRSFRVRRYSFVKVFVSFVLVRFVRFVRFVCFRRRSFFVFRSCFVGVVFRFSFGLSSSFIFLTFAVFRRFIVRVSIVRRYPFVCGVIVSFRFPSRLPVVVVSFVHSSSFVLFFISSSSLIFVWFRSYRFVRTRIVPRDS